MHSIDEQRKWVSRNARNNQSKMCSFIPGAITRYETAVNHNHNRNLGKSNARAGMQRMLDNDVPDVQNTHTINSCVSLAR